MLLRDLKIFKNSDKFTTNFIQKHNHVLNYTVTFEVMHIH